ncbi:hypothetical protein D9758_013419 [Tetrapyrgos nigripes]|uniref:3-beta hydroxysteroid dehydrogenase/isomerase domain-containing protein n=1 Tax=Tetrapyrgos nigripes TaxID=182062 RepID=A0A8H5CK42_9AGAR|nr:hypothetical protein D9758_013419 [Tetrapyrgos nigripes]
MDGCPSLLVFGLVSPNPGSDAWVGGVEYVAGDIVDEAKLLEVFRTTLSITLLLQSMDSQVKYTIESMNAETGAVLSACRAVGVVELVYALSTGVVWTGADIVGASEDDLPIPSKGYDAYHHTKGLGEKIVLGHDGVDGLQVVVPRPCGMTGACDKQLIVKLTKVLKDGQQNIQIGDNTSLVDYLYVSNAARAHTLAANRLFSDPDTVAGQVFFVTNGSPLPPWTFNRLIWKELSRGNEASDDGKEQEKM